MFDVSARDRALYEPAPGATVTAMCYGRFQYVHEPQAVKPAGRPAVKPWSSNAMPTPERKQRKPRTPKQPKTFSPAVLAALAAYERSRAAHKAATA